ncbi:MAG: hypothetical protein HQL09_05085 [Nitrospirae bacterium]|nr:hypothetical protein [Nitrospirota bacterium]
MSLSAVIFSADDIRGALLRKTLEKNGFEVSLYKNIHAAGDILKAKSPPLVIIDKEGYFPGELEYFSSLSGPLAGTSVLVVANSAQDASISLKGVPVEWCLSNPLDLPFIASKAKELLTVKPESNLKALLPATDESGSSEDETLAKDLMGFLGLK